ncbi:MAG: FhaA domain-containing protein [Ilumatobacteraceae bacterium]
MAFKLPGRRTAGTPLRPVEIGRRILRAMDNGIDIDATGRRVAPNRYRINLATADRTGLAELERTLISELVDAATIYANDEGYHLASPVTVEFHTDAGLTPGQITVDARITGGTATAPAATPAPAPAVDPLPPPVITTAAPEPVIIDPTPAETPAVTPPTQPLALGALHSNTGERTPLSGGTTTLGRATENTISLPDAQASRRHAEIRYENGRHVLVDMNSTNGTVVNGTRLTGPHTLRHGDVITIGAIQLRYEAS